MKYALIVTTEPAKLPADGSPEQMQMFEAFFAFNAEIVAKGVYVGGEPLADVATATTLRTVGGEITDGPFAETREQIGGVYFLECADLDEALDWAQRTPNVALGLGAVEVRPCLDFSGDM